MPSSFFFFFAPFVCLSACCLFVCLRAPLGTSEVTRLVRTNSRANARLERREKQFRENTRVIAKVEEEKNCTVGKGRRN